MVSFYFKANFLLCIFLILFSMSKIISFVSRALEDAIDLSFPLRISSVNVTKSVESYGYSHIWSLKKSSMENFNFCAVLGWWNNLNYKINPTPLSKVSAANQKL